MLIVIPQIGECHDKIRQGLDKQRYGRIDQQYISQSDAAVHRLSTHQDINCSAHKSAQQKHNAVIFAGSIFFSLVSLCKRNIAFVQDLILDQVLLRVQPNILSRFIVGEIF